MQSLVEFLLQEIAADEAAARDAQALAGAPWRATHGRQVETAQEGRPVTPEDEHSGRNDPPDDVAAHIARHDPAHVLAVCAAHRSIVEAHSGGVSADPLCRHLADEPCPTLRALATAYADRPGWQEAWR